jgi:Rieske Fe-S protein
MKNCSPEDCPCQAAGPLNRSRRALLKLGLLTAISSPFGVFTAAIAASKPEKMRPQPGDKLVFAFGDREGQIIQSEDIELDAKPVEAYPKFVADNAENSVVRDRSRLNMVLVMRLSPESLNEAMKQNVSDGLLAYSAVCTHTGCTVEGWDANKKQMICPCHGSLYDATNGANVVKGPAPKPLAMLPLRIEAGELTVAGKFSRKVGFQQQRY